LGETPSPSSTSLLVLCNAPHFSVWRYTACGEKSGGSAESAPFHGRWPSTELVIDAPGGEDARKAWMSAALDLISINTCDTAPDFGLVTRATVYSL